MVKITLTFPSNRKEISNAHTPTLPLRAVRNRGQAVRVVPPVARNGGGVAGRETAQADGAPHIPARAGVVCGNGRKQGGVTMKNEAQTLLAAEQNATLHTPKCSEAERR